MNIKTQKRFALFNVALCKNRNMFSKGQIVFAVLFAISFVVAIVMAFKKERAQHQKNFKGVLKLLIGFILFILLLFVLKTYLKS